MYEDLKQFLTDKNVWGSFLDELTNAGIDNEEVEDLCNQGELVFENGHLFYYEGEHSEVVTGEDWSSIFAEFDSMHRCGCDSGDYIWSCDCEAPGGYFDEPGGYL